MAKLRNTIYYEFYEDVNGSEVFRGEGYEVLGVTTIETGVDTIPMMSLLIPLSSLPENVFPDPGSPLAKFDLKPQLQNYIIKVHISVDGVNKYNFQGVIDSAELDDANYSVNISLAHKVSLMQRWPLPINYTIKNTPISHALGKDGAAIGYKTDINSSTLQADTSEPQVKIDYEDDYASSYLLEMTFGSNNKLAALTEAISNTTDLHFYVDLDDPEGDRIVIGRFGSRAESAPKVIVSPYPEYNDECDEKKEPQYVTMLTEPVYDINYTDHFNRAIIFCGDIQDGVCHLTLEQIFAHPELQDPNFPVGKYEYGLNLQPEPEYDNNGKKINNEKIYQNYDIVAFTKNGNREFYVEDKEQLEKDGGVIFHTTYRFDDIYPIPRLQTTNEDGDKVELTITDADRIEISKRAYIRAIRKLKAQRPEDVYQLNTTALPVGVRDGQYIFFTYSKSIRVYDPECDTAYTERKIVNVNTDLYLTKRTITFDSAMNEVATITLDSELRTRDVSVAELELKAKAAEPAGSDALSYPQTYSSAFGDNRERVTSELSERTPRRTFSGD